MNGQYILLVYDLKLKDQPIQQNFREDARNEVDLMNSVEWMLYFVIKRGHLLVDELIKMYKK